MDKWVEGDRAADEFENSLKMIMKSKISFSSKLSQITDSLQKASIQWNKKGDDRVLGKMSISAGTAIEKLAEKEIHDIITSSKDAESQKKMLKLLSEEIENISWLASGFKSSIKTNIVFAIAKVK